MKSAIYPGSFDPLTNGHIDIINRAVRIFDSVVVAVADNPSKTSFFTIEERVEIIKKTLGGNAHIEVDSFKGLLGDYTARKKINTLIRGLRVVTDFDYELSFAIMNRKLNHDLETVFLMTSETLSFVSSSLIKEVARLGGDVSEYVPALVAEKMREKLGKKGA